MKKLGIIIIVLWVLGIIGEITNNSLPQNIFEWMGNLFVLAVGISLVLKNREK